MIVFVSHNIDEVLAISDDISVFRDGQLCETRAADAWTREALMISMVGRVPVIARESSDITDGSPLLRVSALQDAKIRGIELELRAGEIVGIAGLVGSGRSSLLRLLAGATPPIAGTLHLNDEPVSWPRSVRQARRRGIAFLTEDRKQSGIFPEASALENIVLGDLRTVTKRGVVSRRLVSDRGRAAAQSVKFSDNRLLDTINTLSGGNQQKALLARIVHFGPKVFLADEPTRGVDVGAKAEITATLRRIAREGSAVLLVSSEFEELVENCHRVFVLWDGRIVDELTGDAITVDTMVSKAFGPER
jgi:ABC-type sugar transport system ATPase subunit